jgi:hypothetical protein
VTANPYLIALYLNPGAAQIFTLSCKDPGDVITYTIDCTSFLAATGWSLVGASIASDATVEVVDYALSGESAVSMRVAGGTAGVASKLSATLALVTGVGTVDYLVVGMSLPVTAAAATGLVPVTPASSFNSALVAVL